MNKDTKEGRHDIGRVATYRVKLLLHFVHLVIQDDQIPWYKRGAGVSMTIMVMGVKA